MYSSIDQFAFSTDLGDVSTMSGIEVYDKLVEGISMMRKEKNGGLANEFISVNLLTHSHFTNYGGGYYSYLLARMYAAQIWNKRFANDPLNRTEGMNLWNTFLKYGASKDPLMLLEDIGGGKLDPTFLLDYHNVGWK